MTKHELPTESWRAEWDQRQKATGIPEKTKHEAVPVVCDVDAFQREERPEHLARAIDVVHHWPASREELADGYRFRYRGDEKRFLEIARWAANEHRCCSWATFTVQMGPFKGEAGELEMRMTGTADGKALLAEGLKMIEERLAEEKSTNQRGG